MVIKDVTMRRSLVTGIWELCVFFSQASYKKLKRKKRKKPKKAQELAVSDTLGARVKSKLE